MLIVALRDLFERIWSWYKNQPQIKPGLTRTISVGVRNGMTGIGSAGQHEGPHDSVRCAEPHHSATDKGYTVDTDTVDTVADTNKDCIGICMLGRCKIHTDRFGLSLERRLGW